MCDQLWTSKVESLRGLGSLRVFNMHDISCAVYTVESHQRHFHRKLVRELDFQEGLLMKIV